MKYKFFCIVYLFLSISLFAQDPTVIRLDSLNTVELTEWGYYFSDDTSWSPFDLGDQDWEQVDQETFRKKRKGIHWYKVDLQFEGEQNPYDLLALWFYNLPIAYEIYWDGRFLGRNGVPGIDKETEMPGNVLRMYPMNQEMTVAGKHQLIIKTSNFHWANLKFAYLILIGYHSSIQSNDDEIVNMLMRQMSIHLLLILICLVLYFGGIKHPTLLSFGGYAVVIFLYYFKYYFFEYCELLDSYQYQWMETVFGFILNLRYLLLFLFLLHFFEIRRKSIYILISGFYLLFAAAAGFTWNLIFTNMITRTLFVGFLLAIVIMQLKKETPGYRLILSAIALLMLNHLYASYAYLCQPSYVFYPRFIHQAIHLIFPGFIIVAIIIKVSNQYRKFQVISLKAKRLEDEFQAQKKKAQYIIYREKNENHLIPVQDIRFFKAERILVEVHLRNGRMELVEKPLNQLEEILPDHFVRIHRSYIVNIHQVASYQYVSGGVYEIRLKDGDVLPVSRSRAKKLKEQL